jgi:ATP-dependent protease HslVU (ClpYQ) peptidase subunit
MTLLVGGISGASVWMVADTSITGGTIQLRERENQIKIVPSDVGRALIGFAGDRHHGARLMEQARLQPAGTLTVQALLSLDFSNQSSFG